MISGEGQGPTYMSQGWVNAPVIPIFQGSAPAIRRVTLSKRQTRGIYGKAQYNEASKSDWAKARVMDGLTTLSRELVQKPQEPLLP